MEKRLRCKDCKRLSFGGQICLWRGTGPWVKMVNPGQFACKKFVYKDK